MKRRAFSTQVLGLATLGLGGAATGWQAAWAQAPAANAPVEGKHYLRVNPPVLSGGDGKIEVIEFFWYGCPHCYAFESALDAWSKRLPADVAFKRVPVAFRQEPFVVHQKLFYTLESMGLVEKLHRKVFDEIHLNRDASDQKPRLANVEQVGAFAEKQGLDKAQFLSVFNSFSINTKAGQAQKLTTGYQIDGVPALGVQGRFYTSGGAAGDMDKALSVTEFLIQKVRAGGGKA
jgi:thiol:disulfide interchange protein DsbA